MKKLFTILLAAVLVLSLAACGGAASSSAAPAPADSTPPADSGSTPAEAGSTAPAGGSDMKVALLLPGTINDAGWSAAAYNGLMEAEETYGFESAYTESVPLAEQESVIRDYAARGYNLVICHGNDFLDAVENVAPEFPDTKFAVSNTTLAMDNAIGMDVKNEEQGYVAGYALGLLTETGKVGFVGSMELVAQKRVENGFIQGLAAANPDAEPIVTYIGSMDDAAKGKDTAKAVFESGADCVFQYAQSAGIGVVQAAEEEGKLIVVTSPSQQEMAPETAAMFVQTATKANIISAIDAFMDGSFNKDLKIEGTFASGLFIADGYNDELIPADAKEKIEAVVQDLKDGKLELDVTIPT